MAFNIEKLQFAVEECRRFIYKAEDAKKRLKEDKYAGISGSKETAAAKRASLDLTRALAELRKP